MESEVYVKSGFWSDQVFKADDCKVLQSSEEFNGSCSACTPDTFVIELSTGEIISGVTREYY